MIKRIIMAIVTAFIVVAVGLCNTAQASQVSDVVASTDALEMRVQRYVVREHRDQFRVCDVKVAEQSDGNIIVYIRVWDSETNEYRTEMDSYDPKELSEALYYYGY